MFKAIEDRYSPYGVKYDAASLPAVAYHYTDAAGLVGMLSKDVIWATEHRFLNDRSEVQHSLAIVRSLISARLARSPSEEFSLLYSMILSGLDGPQETEVCVFSLSEDADSLSQWRGYARDGHGFTVGFDVATLIRAAEADDAAFGFSCIEYDAARQEAGLSKALDEIEKVITSGLKKTPNNKNAILEQATDSFDKIIWNRAVVNKHESFKSEKEWRIASFVYNEEAMHVRARASGLVPFMELSAKDLIDGEKLPISRIGIGPGFAAQDQLPAIKALCRRCGYDPEIYLASSPYRST